MKKKAVCCKCGKTIERLDDVLVQWRLFQEPNTFHAGRKCTAWIFLRGRYSFLFREGINRWTEWNRAVEVIFAGTFLFIGINGLATGSLAASFFVGLGLWALYSAWVKSGQIKEIRSAYPLKSRGPLTSDKAL